MSLALDQERVVLPKVEGRTVLIDGDILAYQCGYDDSLSFETICHNVDVEILNIMNTCLAEHYKIALTGSYKGGRYDIATVKPYQDIRSNKPRPIHLHPLKAYLEQEHGGVVSEEEADDLLVQWQVEAGCNDSTLIWSLDKDLKMCDGWHYSKKGLVEVHGYGWCEYAKGKTLGYGKSFFWHQMLMGDQVDTIPGLPMLYVGFGQPEDSPKKFKRCGAKTALDYLASCETEWDAMFKVMNAYEAYYEEKWLDMMLEQGRLLWMRREPYEDVLTYFKEVIDGQTDYRHEEIRLRKVLGNSRQEWEAFSRDYLLNTSG